MLIDRAILGASGVVAGALLIAMAVPLAGASLIRLPAEATVNALYEGRPSATSDLRRVLAREEAARAWRDQADGALARGLAHLLLSEGARSDETALDHLRAAETALESGLRRAPARAHGWMRLAIARYRLGRPDEQVVAALAMAMRTGPRETRLAMVRAELILRLWPAPRSAIPRQDLVADLRRAWEADPEHVARLARTSGRLTPLLAAIADSDRRGGQANPSGAAGDAPPHPAGSRR